MSTAIKLAGLVLTFAVACRAQDGLSVRNKTNQRWPTAEAQKIYLSACAVVQREFGRTAQLAPQMTLVAGADRDEVSFTGREIRLIKWNRHAFAQGVVWLAFEDLLPIQQRIAIAARAVNWADSTAEVQELRK